MFGNVTIFLANDRMCNGQMDCPDGSDEDTECGTFRSLNLCACSIAVESLRCVCEKVVQECILLSQ